MENETTLCSGDLWTQQEDHLLSILIEKFGYNWTSISKHIPHRSVRSIRQRWVFSLDPSLKKGRWEPQEDDLLLKYHQIYGDRWSKISSMIPGRDQKSVRKRWTSHFDPDLKFGKWDEEEDLLLTQLFEKFGNSWATIARHIPGRTNLTVKSRWTCICPEARQYRKGFKKWNKDEDKLLFWLANRYGTSKWNRIAGEMPSRSTNEVKSRYHYLQNKTIAQRIQRSQDAISDITISEKYRLSIIVCEKEMRITAIKNIPIQVILNKLLTALNVENMTFSKNQQLIDLSKTLNDYGCPSSLHLIEPSNKRKRDEISIKKEIKKEFTHDPVKRRRLL